MTEASNLKTPLHALHVELGARMAPFAGYDMPIHYPAGVLAEHLHTRKGAGLFDVSHMGQALIEGADHRAVAAFLESLCPADFLNLATGTPALHPTAQRKRRDRRRPHGHAPPAAAGTLRLVVNAAAQGGRLRPHSPTPSHGRPADAASRSGADRASGPSCGGDIGASRSRRGHRDHGLHERAGGADRGLRDLRLSLRLHGRRRI